MRSVLRLGVVCAGLTACLFVAAPGWAQAASRLLDVNVDQQPYWVDVRLSFDARPKYSDSFRYDPDRYLLTFTEATLAMPEERAMELAELSGGILTRISLYTGTDNIAVGLYLTQRQQPFITFDDTGYTIRFYANVEQVRTTQLYQGVSLVEKLNAKQGKNYHAYILKIDPGAPVEMFAAAADRYDGKTRRRAPSSFARREQALAVVNGGFFGQAGEHLSTLIEDGVLRSSGAYPARPALVLAQDGQRVIGRFNVETAIIVNATRIPVSTLNSPFANGKVVVYNNKFPLETLPKEGMYYYLISAGRIAYFSGDPAALSLAPDAMLVATDIIPEANPLRGVTDGSEASLETRITDSTGQVIQARSALGGAPMLVENGAVNITSELDKVQADIASSERSRTAVGLTGSGQLIIAVVKELESAGYGGVTLPVLAQMMLDEGAVTALNLDGGGSSALVVAGDLLNLSEAEERAVSSVLVIKPGIGSNPPGAGTLAAPATGATATDAPIKYERRGPTQEVAQ